MIEEYGLDKLGRRVLKVGGIGICENKKVTFFEWSDKQSPRSDFMKLTVKQKEKMFLRWKWMSTNDELNMECEITRRSLVHGLTEEDCVKLEEGAAHYWRLILEFEKKCREVRAEIGLDRKELTETPKEVTDLVNKFNAQRVDYAQKASGWDEKETQ